MATPHVQLAPLEHAPDEALGEVIPWVRQRPRQLAEMRGSTIMLSGPTAPELLDRVDPVRRSSKQSAGLPNKLPRARTWLPGRSPCNFEVRSGL